MAVAILPQLALSVPTSSDFRGLAILQTAAKLGERGWMESEKDTQQNHYQTYQRYQRDCPVKLEHCRIIKCPNDGKRVLAACQLQLHRRGPKQHKTDGSKSLSPANTSDVFIEWIACHPDYKNKGIGSLLLAWASQYAKQTLHADRLTLHVVKANKKAVRLYSRRGFAIQENGTAKNIFWKKAVHLSTCLGSAVGCDNFTVLTMEKDLF